LLVGSLLLGVFVFSRPRRWPAKGDWKLLLVCGLLWFGVYNVALNEAEQRLDAGTAAMLVNIGPLLIALLAGLLLGEGFPKQLVIGSIAAFGGVVLIGASSSEGKAETWGVVLCIAAAVAYAIGVVAQKPLLGRLPALEVTWIACTIGAISCLPFGPALVRETADARPSIIWWIVFLGAFPTALAFTTWAYALARTSAGRMGRDDVPGSAADHLPRLAAARRGAGSARLRGWRALPRRGGDLPLQAEAHLDAVHEHRDPGGETAVEVVGQPLRAELGDDAHQRRRLAGRQVADPRE
jgi:hypothetical protein